MRWLAPIGAILLLAACTAAPDDAWSGRIEDREGVTWVLNPAARSEPETEARPPFALHLEQTFGAEEEPVEALMSFPTGIAVDDDGNVYVVDRGTDRLVAFDGNGAVLWTAGRTGQGPGEFDQANHLAWDRRDSLYVDNRSGRQVDTWSTAGEYVATRRLSEFRIPQGFVAALPDPDTLVLWAWSRRHGDGAEVHVFDVEGEWRRTAQFFALGGREAEAGRQESWGNATVRVAEGGIWVGNRVRYELRKFGFDGRLQRVIAREHPEIVPPIVYRGTGVALGQFEPPLWLPGGHGVIARFWAPGIEDEDEVRRLWDEYLESDGEGWPFDYDAAVDLVDPEGRVLGSLPLDGPYHESIGTLELIGPDGRLYTLVHDPYPHVRRYRVEVLPH